MLADNKLAENAGWDRNVLAVEFPELAELLVEDGLEISITGFAPVEVDQIMVDFENDNSSPADDVDEGLLPPRQAGREMCGSSAHTASCAVTTRDLEGLKCLMGGERGQWRFSIRRSTCGSRMSSGAGPCSTRSSQWALAKCHASYSPIF